MTINLPPMPTPEHFPYHSQYSEALVTWLQAVKFVSIGDAVAVGAHSDAHPPEQSASRELKPMPDWIIAAAKQIRAELENPNRSFPYITEGRLVAIIAGVAPVLREAKRRHSTACRAYGNYQLPYEECTCGADEWNARLDKVLAEGRKP